MYEFVPPFTYTDPASADKFTPEDARELIAWDREVQPATMLPGDFVEHNGVATIVFRGDPTAVIDWFVRRREFIRARKQKNTARVDVLPTVREWVCTHCGSRARMEETCVGGRRHNPAGPALVKYCRCGYRISKWYTAGVLCKCEVVVP